LQGWIIGAHEFEAHHVFDIWYRNTSDIVPTAITGDMYSVNKANFAILHWFGGRTAFHRSGSATQRTLKLYCADDPSLYEKCLIRPVGQIDRQAIVDEKTNIDQIVATLGLKEMTQATLIRKLCTYTQPNELPARPAVAAQRPSFAQPDRVLPPTALGRRADRRQKGTYRQDRHRDRNQQSVRAADRECRHLLQLRDLVAVTRQMRRGPEPQKPWL
jgi:hypothetical protein